MTPRTAQPRRIVDLVWIGVSLLVLAPTLYYSYVAFYPGFGFDMDGAWKVAGAPKCPPNQNCLRLGDQILAIGDVDREGFFADRSLGIFEGYSVDGVTTLTVLRDGETLKFPIRWDESPRAFLQKTSLQTLLPLIFWLFGTAIVLFLRPRDERWLILVLFAYNTALLLSSGFSSGRHTGGSAIVFHFVVWLFLPLAAHIHTLLPSPLFGRWGSRVLIPLYVVSLVLAGLDYAYLLNDFGVFFRFYFLGGLALSFAFLVVRLFLPGPPAVRQATRIMLFGVTLGFAPIAAFFAVLPILANRLGAAASDINPLFSWAITITLVATPIPPASYIYAIYKHTLGALEFRANRLIGAYSFWALYLTLAIGLLLAIGSRGYAGQPRTLATLLATALGLVVFAPGLHDRFQTLVDRHVFGIRHTHEEVVGLVAEKIPRAFDRSVLGATLVDEILPTLLVRQSALYLFADEGIETLYSQGLPSGEAAPDRAEIKALLARGRRYLAPSHSNPATSEGVRAWVRLALPLEVKEQTLGVWLMGRRDPDDFYPSSDIQLLSTVANQVAPMLENIRLYERAQREIEQRRAIELEIRQSEQRFRALFEATLEGIAIVRDGTILAVNGAMTAIFGVPASELQGHALAELIELGDLGETPLSSEPRETVGRRRDGSTVNLEIAGKQILFQGEAATVVAIRDIDRRKRDEEEKDRLQRQLLLAEKMEAIGRLSAGVAHDFNNCLLAIFGYNDLLMEAYRDDPFLQENLAGLRDASEKAAALTRQLLAFARRQAVEQRVVDLNESIHGLLRMVHRLLGNDVQVRTSLHPDLPAVRLDPNRLEHVLVNLAVNARHAMPDGGVLTLRTEPITVADEAPAEHDVPPGVWALVTISDTGIGMDAETQGRIFEPFFSTREVGEGTGLGLATSYGFIQQSGGHIFVDSAPGEGARFSLYIPAHLDPEIEPEATPEEPPEPGDETILLVEDEDKVREVLRRILEGRGYRVLVAASGAEATELAARSAEPIDLLLTDLTMPGLKGTEIATRLSADRPELRVLYMSGYRSGPLTAKKEGPICLQKPFSAGVLVRAVRKVIDGPPTGV
ncbi:MAG TPA: ATP-binding protein [Thermoanaerobaculia bacterium]|nr:ATP-binding protein [Thermoanaerobaculia bacterium]